MIQKILILSFIFLLISCNKIETQQTLNQADIKFIKNLNLLEDKEVIYKFYSEYKKEYAGNFFTNRRVATYWIDKRDKTKNIIQFAYYDDIANMDTIYKVGLTYSPYILITKKKGDTFKVSVDGDKKEIKSFFEDVLAEWRKRSN